MSVPPLGVPRLTTPSSPAIVEASEPPPLSDGAPATSRRLAPPPKPKQKATPSESGEAVGSVEEGAAASNVPAAEDASAAPVPSSPPPKPPRPAPVDIDFDASVADDKGAANPGSILAAAASVAGAIETPQVLPPSAERRSEPPPPPTPTAPPNRAEAEPEPASEGLPVKSKRQKRPWWEELFSEDFQRANFRLTDAQIAREVSFIEDSLGVAPGGVVLDLGCGAGHHAVELASRGYGVVGYDLSLYQLALAAEVAQARDQKINFLQGDMREMAFEEMFDGVFSWNTTFGYFEEEKNLNVAQRVFKALKPGGMFLVDVINRDFAATQSPSSLWYEGDACVCMDDMSVDFITSRLRVKRSIILDDGRTREVSYSIRLYSLHELGKLLHEVGFRVTEASGHPKIPGVFFGEQSPRIIMLAQKP